MKKLSVRHFFYLASLLTLSSVSHASNERFHVDIRGAQVADAVRLLAKMQGLNVIVPPGTVGEINATFPSIRMSDAMTAVLSSNDLGSIQENNVLRISSKKNIEERGQDLITTTIPLKYAKAEKVVPQVKLLLTLRGNTIADERTNSVTVRDTQDGINSARKFINDIDRMDKQVLIEARIIQGSDNYLRNLGIQWGLSSNSGSFTVNGVDSLGQSAGGRPFMVNTPATGATSGIAMSLLNLPQPFDQVFLDAQLTADEQKGIVSTLSRPSIVTMNNQAATIHSGTKFFVKTAAALSIGAGTGAGGTAGTPTTGAPGAQGAGATSGVQEITSGITLVVTPQVTENNKINLSIQVTQSSPNKGLSVDGIPAIDDNSADTTVLLENGETTVIGGLFQHSVSDQSQGVPFLSRIPILGAIFGRKSHDNMKKELIIFLTPTLVADGRLPAMQGDAEVKAKEIVERIVE